MDYVIIYLRLSENCSKIVICMKYIFQGLKRAKGTEQSIRLST